MTADNVTREFTFTGGAEESGSSVILVLHTPLPTLHLAPSTGPIHVKHRGAYGRVSSGWTPTDRLPCFWIIDSVLSVLHTR